MNSTICSVHRGMVGRVCGVATTIIVKIHSSINSFSVFLVFREIFFIRNFTLYIQNC